MSDIKLFRYNKETAQELSGRSALVERELHDLIEKHMACFLGVRFVAHEYTTGKNHRGRIDSLGLDENNCPVIIEYKRHTNENVINQGLFYLDWLRDHKAEFKLLVMERFGNKVADALEWNGTRVLCIAGDFTKFDEHAVAQMGRSIELIRYKYFADDLLMLEWVNPVVNETAKRASRVLPVIDEVTISSGTQTINRDGDSSEDATSIADAMPESVRLLYDELSTFIVSLGDDINVKELRLYFAFMRLKNFVCVQPMSNKLKLWVKLNPDTVTLEKGFTADFRNKGHWGTGDLQVMVSDAASLEKAKPLIERAYQEN